MNMPSRQFLIRFACDKMTPNTIGHLQPANFEPIGSMQDEWIKEQEGTIARQRLNPFQDLFVLTLCCEYTFRTETSLHNSQHNALTP